ncbi:MAG: Rrf2 family transcriptional regulator [Armatimonadota bacterium]|nr:Rrf2 family transcriptional regulator [Armatimonadota bacterium]MDR7402159.1 Rrf2 family transcriptional regulator [Armatimonadota bacterium]MDR7404672.1 Rrf2 family transcriptional regulator [Armatimonadota bacterium]MDR7436916.1 Rrf2 family transcriptional regulator [Armatimonadota bacterium]MDR7472310.1 Rrf2 family transcriptional regulator [Armatimonadota bacterium]
MRLSRHAHYALRTVLDLCAHPRTRSVDVARRQRIPPAYAAKIIQALARRGIVRTFRGSRGGVALARPPQALTLADVVQAVEGPVAINQCIVWGDCPCPQPCPVRSALARLQAVVEREMAAVTVASLAAGSSRARGGGEARSRSVLKEMSTGGQQPESHRWR